MKYRCQMYQTVIMVWEEERLARRLARLDSTTGFRLSGESGGGPSFTELAIPELLVPAVMYPAEEVRRDDEAMDPFDEFVVVVVLPLFISASSSSRRLGDTKLNPRNNS